MKKIIKDFSNRTAVIEIDGIKHLALRLTAGRKSFSLTRFTTAKHSPGYIISDGKNEMWHISGTCEVDGAVFFYGPYFDGIPLVDYPRPGTQNKQLQILRLLSRGLVALPEEASPLFLNGIFLNIADGRLLILPPAVMELMADEMDREERNRIKYVYHVQARSSSENRTFLTAALSYYFCSGVFPEQLFPYEDFRASLKLDRIPPPHLININLRKNFSDLIIKTMKNPEESEICLFEKIFNEAESIEDPEISNEEREKRKAAADYIFESQERIHRRNRFIKAKGLKIIVIAVAGILAGIVGGKIIYNTAQPSVTAGLSEQELIRLFYDSYNALDHEMIGKCVTKGLVKDDINSILHLFVISKVRQAYEGIGSYIPAGEWIAMGAPVLEGNPIIFGITDLDIKKTDERIYLAEYIKYSPSTMAEPGDEMTGEDVLPIGPTVQRITEKLELMYTDDTWLISSIDEIEIQNLTD